MILEDSHGLLRIYRERHILRIIKYLRKLWKKREGAIYLTGNSDYAENRRSLCIKIQLVSEKFQEDNGSNNQKQDTAFLKVLREQNKNSWKRKNIMSKSEIQWVIYLIECVVDDKWRSGKLQEISQNWHKKTR